MGETGFYLSELDNHRITNSYACVSKTRTEHTKHSTTTISHRVHHHRCSLDEIHFCQFPCTPLFIGLLFRCLFPLSSAPPCHSMFLWLLRWHIVCVRHAQITRPMKRTLFLLNTTFEFYSIGNRTTTKNNSNLFANLNQFHNFVVFLSTLLLICLFDLTWSSASSKRRAINGDDDMRMRYVVITLF